MVQDPREYSNETIWNVAEVGGVEGVLNVKVLVGNWKMMDVIELAVRKKRIIVTDGNRVIAIVC